VRRRDLADRKNRAAFDAQAQLIARRLVAALEREDLSDLWSGFGDQRTPRADVGGAALRIAR
jgi:hypothetical protein